MAGQARSTSSFVDAGTHRRNVKAARLKVNRWAIEYFVPATRPRLETFGTMKEKLQRISNMLLSLCAGFASFAFTLVAVLMMRDLDEQIAASLTMGLFALLIVWVAADRPNSAHARAVVALLDRLLAVAAGGLTSPAPAAGRHGMPAPAAAGATFFNPGRPH